MSIKVYNSSSGRWFLLHWWTDKDRGHLTFSRTVEGLKRGAVAVFESKPWAESRGIYEIEMVGPSPKMELLAAKHDRKEEVDRFYYEMAARMSELVRAKEKLPLPFERCRKYEPEDQPSDVTEKWVREQHYSCKNCERRLRLVGMTREELYEKYAASWAALHPPYEPRFNQEAPRPEASMADPAGDDERIWFAYGDFGHHAGGVELREVDLTGAEEYRPPALSGQVLFYYRRIRKVGAIESAGITAAISEAKAADKERRAAAKARAGAEQREEIQKRQQETLDFFADGITCQLQLDGATIAVLDRRARGDE